MRDLRRIEELVEHGALDRVKACTSKSAYDSRNDATHALKNLRQRHGRDGLIYRCPFNRAHWHITKLKHGESDAE